MTQLEINHYFFIFIDLKLLYNAGRRESDLNTRHEEESDLNTRHERQSTKHNFYQKENLR